MFKTNVRHVLKTSFFAHKLGDRGLNKLNVLDGDIVIVHDVSVEGWNTDVTFTIVECDRQFVPLSTMLLWTKRNEVYHAYFRNEILGHHASSIKDIFVEV